MGQGMLGFEEAGERMTSAYAARYLSELAPLSSDLPAAPRRNAAAAPGGSRPRRRNEPTTRPRESPTWASCRRFLVTTLGTLGFMVPVMLTVLLLACTGIAVHDLVGR